jgi:hypothetical protein
MTGITGISIFIIIKRMSIMLIIQILKISKTRRVHINGCVIYVTEKEALQSQTVVEFKYVKSYSTFIL